MSHRKPGSKRSRHPHTNPRPPSLQNIDPPSLMMVGDSKDDMQCARGAGAVGVLLRNDHNADVEPLADLVVHDLEEIVGLLEKGFSVRRE